MIVIVNNIKHEVATIAEARALAGVAPKPTSDRPKPAARTNPWGDESNGRCNRCAGTGIWGYGTPKAGGCLRCNGTGIAPGHVAIAKPVQVEETETQYLERLGFGKTPYFTAEEAAEYQQLMAKLRPTKKQAARLTKLERKIP